VRREEKMKTKTLLDGKRGAAAPGIFTFKEKRNTNPSRETCRWAREGAE